ncbi:predicted protein [Nematostella vectensis]|uniref:Dual specificity protein phosphatase n=2 Tax=Nematostella vectensis TaxID=45351 RepID=A7T302_NEMVE|nr:predicted protein [Nematostella vectensis]|eukprot:XP_001621766.1 hypothetical protein NEMVEDRAFT_v1g143743 [Nematostella vectensis]
MGSEESTPEITVEDLKKIINETIGKYRFPSKAYDEVFDGIYVGGAVTAMEEDQLVALGVTHVLNAAQGTKRLSHVNTDASFYKSGIIFHGIPATDVFMFKLNKYFDEAADFIASAVGTKNCPKNGRVYVHCKEGISRSATLVLAYLIKHQQMGLTNALRTVRSKRMVYPNMGFMEQLIDYSHKLNRCF